MQVLVQYVIPAFLTGGAIWLTAQDFWSYSCQRKVGKANPVKLVRRLVIALCLLAIAYMMYNGQGTLAYAQQQLHLRDTTGVAIDQEKAVACLNYWGLVMGLVILTLLLAAWDVIEGIRNIQSICQQYSDDEFAVLKAALQKHVEATSVTPPEDGPTATETTAIPNEK